MKYLVWFLVAFVFSGCGAKALGEFKEANQSIGISKLSLVLPDSLPKYKWDVRTRDKARGDRYYGITFDREIDGVAESFDFIFDDLTIEKFGKIPKKLTIEHKKWTSMQDYYDALLTKDVAELRKEALKSSLIYKKIWVVYVANLKCIAEKDMHVSIPSEQNQIVCHYYNTNGMIGKIILDFDIYSHFSTNKDFKESMQTFLKHDTVKILNSIKIHDIDTARMEKEGLMHYDKKYDPNAGHNPLVQWIHPEY